MIAHITRENRYSTALCTQLNVIALQLTFKDGEEKKQLDTAHGIRGNYIYLYCILFIEFYY